MILLPSFQNNMTPEDASSGVFKYLNAGLTDDLMGEFINKAG